MLYLSPNPHFYTVFLVEAQRALHSLHPSNSGGVDLEKFLCGLPASTDNDLGMQQADSRFVETCVL